MATPESIINYTAPVESTNDALPATEEVSTLERFKQWAGQQLIELGESTAKGGQF